VDEFVAKEGGEAGTFAGYAAVFNKADLRGEVIRPGAFIKSLEKWCQRGSMLPMLMEHGEGEDVGIFYDPLRHLPVGEWTALFEDNLDYGPKDACSIWILNSAASRATRSHLANSDFHTAQRSGSAAQPAAHAPRSIWRKSRL